MDKLHYMYKITNQINRKVYIGQTINPAKRWCGHKNQAKQDLPNQLISVAIKKYGHENFLFEIIAICKTYEDANWTEEELIKQFDSLASNGNGYNLSLGGETAPKSEEWKAAMSAIKGGWIGKDHTEENKEIFRQYHLGSTHSEETKQKQSDSMKEKCANDWMPKTIFTKGSEACKYWKGKEGSNKGKVFSEETRKKISESGKGRPAWNKITLSKEQSEEIQKLFYDGISLRKMEKTTGIGRHIIKKELQRIGLK